MEIVNIQNKLNLLFQKVLEPHYVLDNYYGDGLINKLSQKEDPEIKQLQELNFITDNIIQIIQHLNKTHITVQVFIIRVCSIVSQTELNFEKISKSTGNVLEKLFSELNSPEMKPSLKVACMELALSIVNHNSGIQWLLHHGVWRNIVDLSKEKQTIFIVRQTYKFVYKFLWKLDDLGDEASIRSVLIAILKPLSEHNYINIETMSSEDENKHSLFLTPMLHMLLALFLEADRIHKPTILMKLLIHEHNIISNIYVLMDRFHREDINYLLGKLMFWTVLAKCFLAKPMTDDVVYERGDFIDVAVTYFNVLQYFLSRGNPTAILDFCNASNVTWAQVWNGKTGPIFENSQGDKVLIQQQLIFVQLVPILHYIKKNGESCIPRLTDENLQHYLMKLLNSSCEHTARAAYGMRDLMMHIDILPVTLQSVKRLSCLKNHLNNEQANLIFQALFYVLQDYVPVENEPVEELYEDSTEKVQVMTYVMDTILLLIKHFDIHWKESIEILSLYSIVYSILTKRSNLSCKFVVISLNVISLSIKKFHPPNLSLLMETEPGSPIHDLGKLIYKKLHDLNWEVRDSALELLLLCTEIAFVKFPPFQKQIIENNLMDVAAHIALNDHEFYVQASALKCLAAACKVNSIWEKLKEEHPNILDSLIVILRNNQEGIVRKEIVNLLCEIYKNIKLAQTYKQTLYEHLVSTALTDFHWEVQIAALRFWNLVIHTHLTDQGMLDGAFPPVTFSREPRKIVSLNDAEIQKRLLKVLDDLSAIGCLTVLVHSLKEDAELEIMDEAASISNEVLEIFMKYKVQDALPSAVVDQETLDNIMCCIKQEHNENVADETTVPQSEDVIEGILNSNDVNLLANICERQLKLKNEGKDVTPKVKLLQYITPSQFITFMTSKNFKAKIEEKKQWKEGIRSLSSLLDDVLGIYEVSDDVNEMDCY